MREATDQPPFRGILGGVADGTEEGHEAIASVDDVIAAILDRLGPVEVGKLQKLLYYAQGWHLAVTDRRLFAEDLEAWAEGPVIRSVWERGAQERGA